MNDRELMELAAKAPGVSGLIDDLWETRRAMWNPLNDDGDALRLAVKLRIDVLQKYEGATFATNHRLGARELQLSDDPYAATRRAIVRAAAEIRKKMK